MQSGNNSDSVHRATMPETHFGGRQMSCFADRPAGFHALLENAVSNNPAGEALVAGATRLSYRALGELVARATAGFAALGVKKDDRVALLLSNRPEFVIAAFAASRLGAIWVPLNIRDQTDGIRHMLNDSGARLVVAESELAGRLPAPAATPELANRVVVGDPLQGFLPWARLLEYGQVTVSVSCGAEDTVAIFYTSGTTGRAKGAMITNLGIAHSVMHYESAMDLGPVDRSLCVVPLGHITGAIALMAAIVHGGGTLILSSAFKAADFLRLAAQEHMTHTVMVPAQYALCLMEQDHTSYNLSAWRIGGFGGSPMPEMTIARLAEWLPALKLMNLYGATETTSPATILPSEHIASHPQSVGRVVTCGSIRIVDDEGRDLPAGEPGEVWIAGPMVVPGYWRNEAATAAEFTDGYWRSGDIGMMDAGGFLQVFDRKKDMINRGGLKIYSVEVENLLLEDPSVAEAAVVGVPCPVLGERVHAFVVGKTGHQPTPAVLTELCRVRLSDYKVPESFTILDNPLPRNPNGKVLKRDLRERIQ